MTSATHSGLSTTFGYWPERLTITSGQVSIEPLPNIDQAIKDVETDEGVEKKWIYPPLRQVRHFPSGVVTERPYPSRIFGLPKTHAITHAATSSPDDLDFLVWGLAFFTGMRLTTTDRGFLDATPIRPRTLVDFVLVHGLERAVELVENFRITHAATPHRARLIAGAIHALFMAQNPQLLQFERFNYCYMAIDACYALASDIAPPRRRPSHALRTEWLCNQFGMPLPAWAAPAGNASSIAAIRNPALHEALYMGEPLGFALYGVGSGDNLPLEMEALVCRLIVALLGKPTATYVSTPVNTRQMHGLDLT